MFDKICEFNLKITSSKVCFILDGALAKMDKNVETTQFSDASDLLTKQLVNKSKLDNSAVYIGRSPIGYPIVIPMCSKKLFNLEASYSRRYPYILNVLFPNDCLIGVDIELETNMYNNSLNSLFTIKEIELAQLISPLALWSAKEALSKFIKTGLLASIDVFEIESVIYKNGYYEVLFKKFPSIICYVMEYHEIFIAICLQNNFVIENLNELVKMNLD